MDSIEKEDIEIFNYINYEKKRQENNIELIASENFVSKAVLEAMGSILTNKYAEGYSGKRYYGGCENVDKIETLAIIVENALQSIPHPYRINSLFFYKI